MVEWTIVPQAGNLVCGREAMSMADDYRESLDRIVESLLRGGFGEMIEEGEEMVLDIEKQKVVFSKKNGTIVARPYVPLKSCRSSESGGMFES
ncbi:MAG: hypothetical protein HXY34_10135 [Candidatus Thorarchaeota archaeon]|nr:hypothetical protein [Candidatus Thorarchaeota archaeon]